MSMTSDVFSDTDRVLFEFELLWYGWDCDSDAWVMERENGERYIKTTNHGDDCLFSKEEVVERINYYQDTIDYYQDTIANSLKALEMVANNETR